MGRVYESGWVRGSFHRKADWHWFGGGELVEGRLVALCGYSIGMMGGKGEIHGEQMRQDFPPKLRARPTCYDCLRILKEMERAAV